MHDHPLTNWEELGSLGWPRDKVFETFKHQTNVRSPEDLKLNEGFVLESGYVVVEAFHRPVPTVSPQMVLL